MQTPETSRPRAGRPRLAETGERTEALLAVAEQALTELGYERATLNLIARRAGVSKKTIYGKYGGKPGLLAAVLDRIADRFMGADLPRGGSRTDLRDGLSAWARMILAANRSQAAIAITTITLRESRRFPEFSEAMLTVKQARQLAPLTGYLEGFQARGLIRDVDCEAVASLFLWMLAEPMFASVASGLEALSDPAELDRRAALITDLVVGGLTP